MNLLSPRNKQLTNQTPTPTGELFILHRAFYCANTYFKNLDQTETFSSTLHVTKVESWPCDGGGESEMWDEPQVIPNRMEKGGAETTK